MIALTNEYGSSLVSPLGDTSIAELNSFSFPSGRTVSFSLEGVGLSVSGSGNASTDRNAVLAQITANSGALSAAGLQWSATASGISLWKIDGTGIDISSFNVSGSSTSASMGFAASPGSSGSDTLFRNKGSFGSTITSNTSATIAAHRNIATSNVNDENVSTQESTVTSVSTSPDSDPTSAVIGFNGDLDTHLFDMTAGFSLIPGLDTFGGGVLVEGTGPPC